MGKGHPHGKEHGVNQGRTDLINLADDWLENNHGGMNNTRRDDFPNRNNRSLYPPDLSDLGGLSQALLVPCRSHNARLKLHRNGEEAVLFFLSTSNTSPVILYEATEPYRTPGIPPHPNAFAPYQVAPGII